MRHLTLLLLLATPAAGRDLTALEGLGKVLFHAPELSVSGTQSCASCHDPQAGFAAPMAGVSQRGGVAEGAIAGKFGARKVPSAAYAGFAPVLHHVIEDGAPLMIGGLFDDGRARGQGGDPLADQVIGPLTNPLEMALPHAACALRAACPLGLDDVAPEACAAPMPALLARDCATPGAVMALDEAQSSAVAAGMAVLSAALAAYERSPEVSRFSSPFDRGTLTAQEQRGLALFTGKALCAECHITEARADGTPALLTDFTFDNLGVPANPEFAVPVDRGLAATLEADPVYAALASEAEGKHKVPTLRNLTAGEGRRYMHNGYFATLEGVVRFYNTRELWPRCAQALSEAQALAAHCWPAPEVAANVNVDELGNLKLTEAEEADIVAFLHRLDDD